jgi:predicted metal-dependent HD superfamily phosphohydrolase
MNAARWKMLMNALAFPASEATFDAIEKAYCEPHRRYHTTQHIDDCLVQFDLLRMQADAPAAIELSLWFHDAVYNPYKSRNEEKSADWAARFLVGVEAAEDFIVRIRSLILATRHEVVATDNDAAILVDVDLSILGSDNTRYDAFERQVREEYRWVPSMVYRRERRKILESFMMRDRIYRTRTFFDLYESIARNNLDAAIRDLK